MKKREKTGLSPVIATILLISIVVVIGTIIFLWARGFVKEEGMKSGENVKLSCPKVDFRASYEGSTLSIVNDNVPVWRVNLKIYSDGGYTTKQLTEANDWDEDIGLRQGRTYTGTVSLSGSPDRILVIPVLLASSGSGQKIYTCEDQYGYEIQL